MALLSSLALEKKTSSTDKKEELWKTDRVMETAYFCTECKGRTRIVYDHPTRATVCSDCGLVLAVHSDHETTEGETLAYWDDIFCDSRALDPIIMDGSTPRDVSNPKECFLPSSSRKKRIVAEEGFETMAIMCNELNLCAAIRDRANENYRTVKGRSNTINSRNHACLAACIDIACQQEGVIRTSKEICSVVGGITKTELAQMKNRIKKQYYKMGKSLEIKTINAGDCVRRYCSRLVMEDEAVKAVEEALEKSEKLDIRKNPQTIVAAVIYMVAELSPDHKLSLENISNVVNVAQQTIRIAYRHLYPYATTLIPTWYANEEDIRSLPSNLTTSKKSIGITI